MEEVNILEEKSSTYAEERGKIQDHFTRNKDVILFLKSNHFARNKLEFYKKKYFNLKRN